MKLNLNKKTLNFLLLTIAFTIWMVVFLKIILPDNPEDEISDTKSTRSDKSHIKTTTELYDPKIQKDPFSTPFNKKQKVVKLQPSPQPKREVQQTPAPQLRLLGIVSDDRGRMAIIQFQDGTTKFMREKDEAEHIKITLILEREVEFQFENRKIKLNL